MPGSGTRAHPDSDDQPQSHAARDASAVAHTDANTLAISNTNIVAIAIADTRQIIRRGVRDSVRNEQRPADSCADGGASTGPGGRRDTFGGPDRRRADLRSRCIGYLAR